MHCNSSLDLGLRDLVFSILGSIIDVEIVKTNSSFWLLIKTFVVIVTLFMTAIALFLAKVIFSLLVFLNGGCVELCYWNTTLLTTITTLV